MSEPGPRGEWNPSSPVGEDARPWWRKKRFLIPIAVVAVCVFLGAVTSPSSKDDPADNGPADQRDFVAAVEKGRDGYKDTENEIKQRQLQTERDEAVCAAVPERSVSDWVGTIAEVDTSGSGRGILEVEIAEDTRLATWGNSFSDYSDDTLIDKDSPIYSALAELEVGDTVVFSGTFFDDDDTCLSEQSVTLNGQMSSPTFVFRFTELQGE